MNSQFRIMRGGELIFIIHKEVGRKDPNITENEYVMSIIRLKTKRKNIMTNDVMGGVRMRN